MAQYGQKRIFLEKHFLKEFKKLPIIIQEDFMALFKELSEYGSLKYPDGKKLQNYNIFEGRVNNCGVWRCLYAYINKKDIVVLSIFRKKTQKTPSREIQKGLDRLNKLKR